jgi:hypothetical protein
MARVVLPVTSLPADTAVNIASAFTTGDATNDHYIAAGPAAGSLILLVRNSNGAEQTLTILAGDGGDTGPACRAILGDLAIPVAATSGQQAIHITDTARFMQSDGTIHVDVTHANLITAVLGLS